ncbi:MAG: hypothetical protein AMJ92_00905 [candidate division Zixibacteria bacterium SM23_81]|nr:MAG: hypothetical protein AMJ92_00905 [candidate division Zixibacteria bacterium SM23_81]
MGVDPELAPRQRIASVGYAFQAAEADTADYSRKALAVDDGDWTISGSNIYSAVSGNVGIGTATPARKLDVQTTGGIGIYVENDHATLAALYARNYSTGPAARFQTGDVLVQYGDVLVNYGKVGIGTLTPGCALEVRNSSGTAVRAYATGSSGYGVDAYSSSPTGIAVYGFNESESGNAYAFYGENISPNGIAIYGLADNGDEYSTGIGVYGRTDGDNGAAGVYGEATNTGGNNRGVWGHTDNPNGHAGYFTGGRNYFQGSVGIGITSPDEELDVSGDARVSGAYRYSTTKTHYLNMPACEFQQADAGDDDYYVLHEWGCGFVFGDALPYVTTLYSPVHLPDGATVTEFRVYYYDNEAGEDIDVNARLVRRHNYESMLTTQMAQITLTTSGSSTSVQSSSDNTIDSPTIDNSPYQYLVSVFWDQHNTESFNMRFFGCKITYTIDKLNP